LAKANRGGIAVGQVQHGTIVLAMSFAEKKTAGEGCSPPAEVRNAVSPEQRQYR
jgi:hypothetical protein